VCPPATCRHTEAGHGGSAWSAGDASGWAHIIASRAAFALYIFSLFTYRLKLLYNSELRIVDAEVPRPSPWSASPPRLLCCFALRQWQLNAARTHSCPGGGGEGMTFLVLTSEVLGEPLNTIFVFSLDLEA
jgi:hypothetical protein